MTILRALVRHPRGLAGLIPLLILIGASVLATTLAPYDPTEYHLLHKYEGPSPSFIFGTDQYGRDIFSRVLVGGQLTFLLGVGATLVAMVGGILLGMTSGYVGGLIDEALMRLNDAVLSIPSLLLALLIVSTLGSSLLNAILAIGVVFIPRVTRIVRSAAIALKRERFVDAARADGESMAHIIFREILPNAWPTVLVEATYRFGFALFTGASLSFLGLGVQPPNPEWGLMIRQAKTQLLQSPWPLLFPTLAILVSIVAANLLGDALGDILGKQKREM
mgnify:CR=1 FL=1